MKKNYVQLQGKLETFPQPFHPHLSSRHRSKAARTAAASRSGSSSGGRSSSLPCRTSGCFRGRSTIQMGFQPIHSHIDLHATNPLINLSIQIPSTTQACNQSCAKEFPLHYPELASSVQRCKLPSSSVSQNFLFLPNGKKIPPRNKVLLMDLVSMIETGYFGDGLPSSSEPMVQLTTTCNPIQFDINSHWTAGETEPNPNYKVFKLRFYTTQPKNHRK